MYQRKLPCSAVGELRYRGFVYHLQGSGSFRRRAPRPAWLQAGRGALRRGGSVIGTGANGSDAFLFAIGCRSCAGLGLACSPEISGSLPTGPSGAR
jgi:hypothetical protein